MQRRGFLKVLVGGVALAAARPAWNAALPDSAAASPLGMGIELANEPWLGPVLVVHTNEGPIEFEVPASRFDWTGSSARLKGDFTFRAERDLVVQSIALRIWPLPELQLPIQPTPIRTGDGCTVVVG